MLFQLQLSHCSNLTKRVDRMCRTDLVSVDEEAKSEEDTNEGQYERRDDCVDEAK